MARRVPFPLPLPLLLLFPGSWVLSDRRMLRRVAGETLSVTCNYPSPGETYKEKSLCREVAGFVCAKLVPSPGAQGRAPRLSVWDEPEAGLFTVSLAELREKDSGHYWCSMRHTRSNTVFNSAKFYLAVSPAPTQASKAACNPTSSKTWSSVSPTGRATEAPWAPSAFTTAAQPQNATLCPGPAVPCALLPGFCGLLVTKSLALLFLLWVLRNRCVRCRWGSWEPPAPAPGPQGSPEPQDLKQEPRVPQTWAPRRCSLTSEPFSPAKTRPELGCTSRAKPEGPPQDQPPAHASLHPSQHRLLVGAKPSVTSQHPQGPGDHSSPTTLETGSG